MAYLADNTIPQSWTTNADAWTRAVRSGSIESRERVTNAAIVDAVLGCHPGRVLDLGCGEGWLVRALAAQGVQAVGVDASPGLIEAARASGGGEFFLGSYEELTRHPGQIPGPFDVIVANFALLQEHLSPLLRAVSVLLTPRGRLIIQTVHPGGVEQPQQEGWRQEDFRSFEGDWQAMPWYYRSLDSWTQLLGESGYQLEEIREPLHPDTCQPLSLILAASPLR
ncbi:class I SAM-dependent methyltransferase [Marinobacter sp. M1N3S26]|uniref:class I SAM-dependent methyltransferase n=1 Tax=Marinobacter sp. M1N3S26 TaxID=3382299 RepID=UPI00387B0630